MTNKAILTFYTISPTHAGTESSMGAIDNPIQRERHTGWPVIHSTGVKGALREHYRSSTDETLTNINYIFGFDSADHMDEPPKNLEKGENFPGTISFSDAKLLAFPVRSNISPFVYVTSPMILKRLKRDMDLVNMDPTDEIDIPTGDTALWINYNENENNNQNPTNVILEDAVVTVMETKIYNFVTQIIPTEMNTTKLILISDEMFDYIVSNCTEVQTQIKIDPSTGTAQDGALRYEELLPSDSLLYSVVYTYNSVTLSELMSDNVMSAMKKVISGFVQLGGGFTLGRGICKVNWIDNNNNNGGK